MTTVWLDETYYPVIASEVDRKEDGTKYRGLSHNLIFIGAATDKRSIICFVEDTGKPSQKKSFQAFGNHITSGSTLAHDKESAHKRLFSVLDLTSQGYSSKDLKGLKDRDNPLDPVNSLHDSLKKFLNVHTGYSRNNLQDYLNLFAFVRNPPVEPLEKVEKLSLLAFQNPILLHHRDQFVLNQGLIN